MAWFYLTCGITRSRCDQSVSLHRGSLPHCADGFVLRARPRELLLSQQLAGTAVLGMVAFNEQATPVQVALIGGLIVCIAGL
jgi:hypothetical protein